MTNEITAATKRLAITVTGLLLFVSGACYAPPSESKLTMNDFPYTYLMRFDSREVDKALRHLSKDARNNVGKSLVKGEIYSWLMVQLTPDAVYRNGFNRAQISPEFIAQTDMILDLHKRTVYRGKVWGGYDLSLRSVPPFVIYNMPVYNGRLK